MGAILALAASVTLASCSGVRRQSTSPERSNVVVRVGGTAITRGALWHWMRVLSPTNPLPEPPRYERCISSEREQGATGDETGLRASCHDQYVALQRRALTFLITLAWVNEGGARMHTGATPAPKTQKASSPKAFAAASADARLLELTESRIAGIRGALRRQGHEISRAVIRRYYLHDKGSFERPEKRSFDIVEQLPDPTVASHLMTTLRRSGTKIKTLIARRKAGEGVAIHEVRDEPPHLRSQPLAWGAIFTARPHVLAGPVPLFQSYAIFEVDHIFPAHRPTLSEVSKKIASHLESIRYRRSLDAFANAWRARWKSRTNCAAGYLVEECRGYHSQGGLEDTFPTQTIIEGVRRAYQRS